MFFRIKPSHALKSSFCDKKSISYLANSAQKLLYELRKRIINNILKNIFARKILFG